MASMSCPAGRCFSDPLLRETEWRVLSENEIAWLNSSALCKLYQPGECIFHEGDESRGIYVVCEGLIGLRRHDPNGESILMRLAERGDPMGYRPFLAEEPHQTTAEVLKPSRVCFLGPAVLHELFAEKPSLAMAFLRRVSHDLGEAQERFHQTVTLNLRARLAHFLLVMKERYGRETPDGRLMIELPISRRDMAEMIGVRSESLSRTIRQMTDDGVLTFSGHRAWIDDADLLLRELGPHLERRSKT